MGQALYTNGDLQILVQVVRRGSHNTRVRFPDGHTEVVANETLADPPGINAQCRSKRIIPRIPLEDLYQTMRSLKGTAIQKFQSTQGLLSGRHGATASEFIIEMFRRSVSASGFYANADEAFYSNRQVRIGSPATFAPHFVQWVSNVNGWNPEGTGYQLRYVDFEIFPYRTTLSCRENGAASTYGNAGGIDLLMASRNGSQTVPAIVEIKAKTEVVGPTFALVQALMYSAQMLTPHQFQRLANIYPSDFRELNTESPSADILIVLEESESLNRDDLAYATELARGVRAECDSLIRTISFLRLSERADGFVCIGSVDC